MFVLIFSLISSNLRAQSNFKYTWKTDGTPYTSTAGPTTLGTYSVGTDNNQGSSSLQNTGYAVAVPEQWYIDKERTTYLNPTWASYLLKWGKYDDNKKLAAIYLGELCEQKYCDSKILLTLAEISIDDSIDEKLRMLAEVSLGRAAVKNPDINLEGHTTALSILNGLAISKTESLNIRNSALVGMAIVPNSKDTLIAYHKKLVIERSRSAFSGYPNSYEPETPVARLEANTLQYIYSVGGIDYLRTIVRAPRPVYITDSSTSDETSIYTASLLMARYYINDAKPPVSHLGETWQIVLADLKTIQTSNKFDVNTKKIAANDYKMMLYGSTDVIGAPAVKGLYIPTDKELQVENALSTVTRIVNYAMDLYMIGSAVCSLPRIWGIVKAVFRSGAYTITPIFDVAAYELKPIAVDLDVAATETTEPFIKDIITDTKVLTPNPADIPKKVVTGETKVVQLTPKPTPTNEPNVVQLPRQQLATGTDGMNFKVGGKGSEKVVNINTTIPKLDVVDDAPSNLAKSKKLTPMDLDKISASTNTPVVLQNGTPTKTIISTAEKATVVNEGDLIVLNLDKNATTAEKVLSEKLYKAPIKRSYLKTEIDATKLPYNYSLDQIEKSLDIKDLTAYKGKTVISLGEGDGKLTAALTKEGSEAYGIDTWYDARSFNKADIPVNITNTDEVTKAANSMLTSINENQGRLVAGDARYLPLADKSVDVVLSNKLINNMSYASDMNTVVEESLRVLKPGGEIRMSGYTPSTGFGIGSAGNDYKFLDKLLNNLQSKGKITFKSLKTGKYPTGGRFVGVADDYVLIITKIK